jgi:hypothetical protein
MNNNPWILISRISPPVNEIVETKMDDCHGCRNNSKLIWGGKLWWTSDKAMYVYYTPTHWRKLE